MDHEQLDRLENRVSFREVASNHIHGNREPVARVLGQTNLEGGFVRNSHDAMLALVTAPADGRESRRSRTRHGAR